MIFDLIQPPYKLEPRGISLEERAGTELYIEDLHKVMGTSPLKKKCPHNFEKG